MVMIRVISTDRCEPWQVLRLNPLEPLVGCYTSIQRRAGDQQHHHPPQGLHHARPCAAFKLLATLIATLGTASRRRLDRLAVATHGTGCGLPACTRTRVVS